MRRKTQEISLKKMYKIIIDDLSWFTVPYISIISEKLKNTIKDLDTNMSYFSLNKLRNIIRGH